jgi:hypothetical protein
MSQDLHNAGACTARSAEAMPTAYGSCPAAPNAPETPISAEDSLFVFIGNSAATCLINWELFSSSHAFQARNQTNSLYFSLLAGNSGCQGLAQRLRCCSLPSVGCAGAENAVGPRTWLSVTLGFATNSWQGGRIPRTGLHGGLQLRAIRTAPICPQCRGGSPTCLPRYFSPHLRI